MYRPPAANANVTLSTLPRVSPTFEFLERSDIYPYDLSELNEVEGGGNLCHD